MASITKTRKSRGRGRPFVGATPVQVRMPPAELAALDAWIGRQKEPMTRPEAIRRIVSDAMPKTVIVHVSKSDWPSKKR